MIHTNDTKKKWLNNLFQIKPKMEKETKWYEYANKRICKYWLQRETCRQCLFEILCDLEWKKDLQRNEKKWTEY